MKRYIWLTLLLILPAALVACGGAQDGDGAGAYPAAQEAAAPSPTPDEIDVSAGDPYPAPGPEQADCAAPGPGEAAFVDEALGLCFTYPDRYQAQMGEEGTLSLFVDSIQNTEAPLAQISVAPADGRSLDDITAERLAAYGLPDGQPPQAALLGDQPALRLRNLPGQDTNDRFVVLADGRVYDLVFYRTGPDYGAVAEEAEALIAAVTGSLRFLPGAG